MVFFSQATELVERSKGPSLCTRDRGRDYPMCTLSCGVLISCVTACLSTVTNCEQLDNVSMVVESRSVSGLLNTRDDFSDCPVSRQCQHARPHSSATRRLDSPPF